MADIPVKFNQDGSSSRTPVNRGGRTLSYAQSGKPRITAAYADQRFEFELVYLLLSESEMQELDDFYRANESLDVTFQYVHDGGNTYSGYFIDLPSIDRQGPDIYNVTYHLTARRII